MSVFAKLQQARLQLQQTKLKKSGRNTFSKYDYFELGDFLPAIQSICGEVGLCGCISFDTDVATLFIVDVDKPEQGIKFTSPMASADLKGCHPIQSLGAVETYQRRYLWMTAFEIVEHDALEVAPPKDEDVLAKMAAATDYAALKQIFGPAYKAAQKARNKAEMDELTAAYNEHKARLTAGEDALA